MFSPTRRSEVILFPDTLLCVPLEPTLLTGSVRVPKSSLARLQRTARLPVAGKSGALAAGALALGAFAIGALAVGSLAIGALAIYRARIKRLEIDELVIRRLRREPPPARRADD
jgi:hypothetical protein